MQAKPEIQGIHHHVELSLESPVENTDVESVDINQDESELVEVQDHQTETVLGSQVVCAVSRMAQAEQPSKRREHFRVTMYSTGAVLALVGVYVAIILL